MIFALHLLLAGVLLVLVARLLSSPEIRRPLLVGGVAVVIGVGLAPHLRADVSASEVLGASGGPWSVLRTLHGHSFDSGAGWNTLATGSLLDVATLSQTLVFAGAGLLAAVGIVATRGPVLLRVLAGSLLAVAWLRSGLPWMLTEAPVAYLALLAFLTAVPLAVLRHEEQPRWRVLALLGVVLLGSVAALTRPGATLPWLGIALVGALHGTPLEERAATALRHPATATVAGAVGGALLVFTPLSLPPLGVSLPVSALAVAGAIASLSGVRPVAGAVIGVLLGCQLDDPRYFAGWVLGSAVLGWLWVQERRWWRWAGAAALALWLSPPPPPLPEPDAAQREARELLELLAAYPECTFLQPLDQGIAVFTAEQLDKVLVVDLEALPACVLGYQGRACPGPVTCDALFAGREPVFEGQGALYVIRGLRPPAASGGDSPR